MGSYLVLLLWVKVDLGVMVMKSATHSPELNNWSLTIRCSLVSYTAKVLFGRVLPLCKRYSQHILSLADRAQNLSGSNSRSRITTNSKHKGNGRKLVVPAPTVMVVTIVLVIL